MKRLAIFLATTFGLSWGTWIVGGIAFGTFANGESSSPVMIALVALSMFFPLVGALVANACSRPEERLDLGFRPLIKKNAKYYLAAWFGPAALTVVGTALFYVMFPQLFDPQNEMLVSAMQQSGLPEDQSILIIVASAASAITFAPFINMIPALGEEVGWRSMLLPTLGERMSQRAAVLASGAIWGLWHAPVIAMGHNYGMEYVGFPVLGIITMTVMCIALGSFLSYLRIRSSTIWPCALAHGAFNAVAGVGSLFCSCGLGLLGPSPLGLVAGIPVIAAGVFCLMRLKPDRA